MFLCWRERSERESDGERVRERERERNGEKREFLSLT